VIAAREAALKPAGPNPRITSRNLDQPVQQRRAPPHHFARMLLGHVMAPPNAACPFPTMQ